MAKKNEVRDMVHAILKEKTETRDNDMYLASAYWYKQLNRKGIDATKITGLQMLSMLKNYKDNGLVSFETISRQRRLIQETTPELRGEEWEKRHAKQEEVKEDIRDFKMHTALSVSTNDDKPNEELLNGKPSVFGNHQPTLF